MESVIVSDTNMFIDLVEVGLLDPFFALPWKIHTTDMVLYELKDKKQKEMVVEYQDKGFLHVKRYESNEMLRLARFHSMSRQSARVSIQDCSVWLYAKDSGYVLLTGDGRLKSAAAKSGVVVHGILYVIDQLVEGQLLSKDDAAGKLNMLMLLNPRLPMSEMEKRVKFWQGNEKVKCL